MTAASGVDPSTGANANDSDVFYARLDGASGNPLCSLRFGDYASQEADGLFIARAATGGAKDVAFVSGLLSSVLDFGTVSLSTSGSATSDFWIAKF